ncbi:MAG: hypothetical protein WEA35_02535 [Candidatus Nanopelagicales bacterium]
MPKWIVAVGAGALLVLLVAAAIWATRADSETTASTTAAPAPSSSALPTPTPTPTPEIVLWAGDVCVARDGFIDSVVAVASSLEYDPTQPGTVGEQFQRQIEGQFGTIEAEASAMGTALGGIPVDYVEVAAAVSQLQGNLDSLIVAKDAAQTHITAAQQAGDPLTAGVEWLRAAGAAKAAYDVGVESIDSLQMLTGATEGDVGDAFTTAPQCG